MMSSNGIWHGDDDFASSVSSADMVKPFTCPPKGVGSVDNRCDLASLDQRRQHNQVLLVRRHDERRQPLAHERKRYLRPDKATPACDPPMVEAPAVRHEHPPRSEGASEVGQRVV